MLPAFFALYFHPVIKCFGGKYLNEDVPECGFAFNSIVVVQF
jgi:hypothetical protein